MKIALDTLWASVVRTVVPAIVGALLTWLVTLGIDLDPEFAPALESFLFVAFSAAYHLAIRLLETHVSPRLGWLLGSARQPLLYAKTDGDAIPVITGLRQTEDSAFIQIRR